MTDIDIKCSDGNFKIRACGVIKQGNKILTQKMTDYNGVCFPGGHVQIGETSETAVKREIKEELYIDTNILKLLCVNENIYFSKSGKTAHEIGFYYLLEPITPLPEIDFSLDETSEGKTQEFKWIEISNIDSGILQPYFLGEIIIFFLGNFFILITFLLYN